MYRVELTESGEEDLRAALQYISGVLKNPGAAKALLAETETRLKQLEDLPFSFPPVSDDVLSAKGVRLFPVKGYLVFYIVRETEKRISVIRFRSSRRNWAYLLKEEAYHAV